MESISTLVAVRYQIVRDGIEQILANDPGVSVSGVAQNIENLPQSLLKESSVLILDLDMPDINASEIIVEQGEKNPNLNILVIGEKRNSKRIKNIIKAGASGYILKEKGADELIKAVKEVSAGETYLCEGAKQLIMQHNDYGSDKGRKIRALTQRELEVLVLICKELTNKEIAKKLHISVRTVDAHRRNILQKTTAKNTAGLVKYAIKHKIYSA